MISLWRICRPPHGMIGGMAAGFIPAPQVLPEAGGVLDQSAWLLDAFSILDAADAERRQG